MAFSKGWIIICSHFRYFQNSTQLIISFKPMPAAWWVPSSLYTTPALEVALLVKNSLANARDLGDAGSIPVSGRSPRGGHDNPLQDSCLENPHGQRSLVGYNLWGPKESDKTEQLSTSSSSSKVHHAKWRAGRITSWNQDCQEKYQ